MILDISSFIIVQISYFPFLSFFAEEAEPEVKKRRPKKAATTTNNNNIKKRRRTKEPEPEVVLIGLLKKKFS